MLIDIAVVPTFSQEALPPKGPFTLRDIDATSTTVQALCDAVYVHLTGTPIGVSTGAIASEEKEFRVTAKHNTVREGQAPHSFLKTTDVTVTVDGVDLCLTAGGVVLSSSDATTVLANLHSVASAIHAHARRPVLPNRTSRPRPPSRPLITMHVVEKPQPYLIRVTLAVVGTDDRQTVQLPPNATVGELRVACAAETGIPEDDLTVLPRGQHHFIDMHQPLSQCHLTHGAVVHLGRLPGTTAPIGVFQFSRTGPNVELRLPLTATIEDVKAALQPAMGLEREDVVLRYAARELEDGTSLADHNIPPNSRMPIWVSNRFRPDIRRHVLFSRKDEVLVASLMDCDIDEYHFITVVKVVDTAGTIPFDGSSSITLARPCLGSTHVWFICRRVLPVMDPDRYDPDANEKLDPNAVHEHIRVGMRASLVVALPEDMMTSEDDDERHGTDQDEEHYDEEHSSEEESESEEAKRHSDEVSFYFDTCQTAEEVLRELFSQVAQKLPLPIKERGFDLYIVRPSGAEVLLDGVAPLLSPLNARKTLIVRPVAEGTQPAFAYDQHDDATSDSSSDEGLASGCGSGGWCGRW